MANQQNYHPALVIKTYESITFTGNRHIRPRQGQQVELVARRGDIIEITFPSPSTRQAIRMTMNSKYVTIYWTENTGSLILYVNDKHSPSGYPKIHVRNETGFRGWTVFSSEATIHADLAQLLGTDAFGNNRLMALQWNRHANTHELKPLRKAVCHTKWQNVSSLELRRRCMHMLEDAGMTFGHYFRGLPTTGAGPSAAPTTNAGANATVPVPTSAPAAANPPAGMTTSAVAHASAGANAPVAGANNLGATNAPAGATNVATNNNAATNAPVTGANAARATNAPASVNTSAGPSAQSATMQDAPPREPKRPVTWYPLTLAHLIRVESEGNRAYNPITAKPRGTIRPPAVFHFDDSDPFGSTASGSKVASVAQVPPSAPQIAQTARPAANEQGARERPRFSAFGQLDRGIAGPPPLPPLPPQLAARFAAIPQERRAVEAAVEATESLTEAQGPEVKYLTDEKIHNILEWQEGLARAEAEAEAEETPLPGTPSGMLIDLGDAPEVSAPEGGAWGGRFEAEALDEVASELAGLEFRPTGTGAEGNGVGIPFPSSGLWEDLERWNEMATKSPR
ncbi:hypothetical protein TWF718_011333 [Orbilia javanica]|uniref:Uncharacterized protein n=1 Tax=Orbilia javanica TaxID=47235 RepID=A0AAN8R9M6_9PEZI